MAERYEERRQALLLMRRELATIEAHTAAMQHDISAMGEQAREHAWMIQEHGLSLGDRGQQLFPGGPTAYEAPKVHPVWSDDLRHETQVLREMGEAGTEKPAPWEVDFDKWPSAHVEGFYGALDGRQADGPERADIYGLSQLHDRRDELQQTRQQAQSQSRDHGMGY